MNLRERAEILRQLNAVAGPPESIERVPLETSGTRRVGWIPPRGTQIRLQYACHTRVYISKSGLGDRARCVASIKRECPRTHVFETAHTTSQALRQLLARPYVQRLLQLAVSPGEPLTKAEAQAALRAVVNVAGAAQYCPETQILALTGPHTKVLLAVYRREDQQYGAASPQSSVEAVADTLEQVIDNALQDYFPPR